MRTIRVSIPRLGTSALLILLGSACEPESQPVDSPSVQIDHVIVAIGDLQTGIERFEELTGVQPAFGGDHPGRGTRNALVSLGPGLYLELLAPQEGVVVVDDAPDLADLTELTPSGWAASTTDMAGTLARLSANGYEPSETASGSRATPGGGLLTWTTGMVAEPVIPGAPFFIEWGADSPHPATTSPTGCELEGLTILTPEPGTVKGFLDVLGLSEEVGAIRADTGGYRITLRCPSGTVTFQ